MTRKLMSSLLATALLVLAGAAVGQTIDDIQYYDPVTGDPASPHDGELVTVTGTVYVQPGTYNSGTHYIQGATGGIQFFLNGTGLTYGDVVEVTGIVSAFSGEIQIGNNQNPPAAELQGSGPEATPTEITPSGIFGDTEPYEWVGNFVAVTGEIATVDGNEFGMMDSGGGSDTLLVYVDSDTGIDMSGVNVGDEYKVLGPVVNFNGLIELKPRRQTDLIADPTLPVIGDLNLANWVPLESTPIVVSAEVTDDQGIQSGAVFYRDSDTQGQNPGPWNSVAMSSAGGNTWEGTIPPRGSGVDKVDFYVSVTDVEGQTVTLPGSAPDAFREVAVGITPIYEVQYRPLDDENQDNNFVDLPVNVRGVVTAGTGDTVAPSQFILQEQETGPYGGYRFGGIVVYEGTATYEYFRGDVVEVGGKGDEYFNLTELRPYNADAVNLVAFGADLPEPMRVHTAVLADAFTEDGDGPKGEAYESVWVKTWASEVIGITDYEYLISDTGQPADSLEVDSFQELTYQPTLGDVILVEGFMDFSYGDFMLRPIGDEFITTGITAVEDDDTPTVTKAGGFTSVHPNPFNPATKLEFVLNRDELTQLNIYNLRGELVRSLVNERLPRGDYALTWDGTDTEGQAMASGQYFARLRIGKTVMQVRKLSLVK